MQEKWLGTVPMKDHSTSRVRSDTVDLATQRNDKTLYVNVIYSDWD